MDDKIYVGQDFNINMTIDDNLVGATDLKMMIEDPDGVQITPVNLTVLNAAAGTVFFLSQNNEFNRAGNWIVWAEYTDSNNLDQIGSPQTIKIYKPGK